MSALATEGLFSSPEPEQAQAKPARRGTSNSNQRGGSETRRRRRAWLVETYRADVDVAVVIDPEGEVDVYEWSDKVVLIFGEFGAERRPACRCYRCGELLADLADVDPTNRHPRRITVDRIIPGCKGGTYKRTNIRPACWLCNERTGQALSTESKRASA